MYTPYLPATLGAVLVEKADGDDDDGEESDEPAQGEGPGRERHAVRVGFLVVDDVEQYGHLRRQRQPRGTLV